MTTAAWAEFSALYSFQGGQDSLDQTLDPADREEVQALGAISCAVLDVSESSLALVGFDGQEGEPFNLKAVLLDGADQLTLFDWSGTLDADAKVVALSSSEAGLNQQAADRIGTIARGADKSIRVRYDFESASSPARADVRVVLRVHMATADGTCPAQ